MITCNGCTGVGRTSWAYVIVDSSIVDLALTHDPLVLDADSGNFDGALIIRWWGWHELHGGYDCYASRCCTSLIILCRESVEFACTRLGYRHVWSFHMCIGVLDAINCGPSGDR